MAAQHAQTAGWSARFLDAVPTAVLGAALVAFVGLLGWMAISLVNLNARVTALEEGQKEIKTRLTRLETRVDDIYKILVERLPPPPEQNPPQR